MTGLGIKSTTYESQGGDSTTRPLSWLMVVDGKQNKGSAKDVQFQMI